MLQNAKETNEATAAQGISDFQRALDSFYADLRTLLTNKDYVLLLLSFSIGVGFFNALLTLLNQLVNPFGYRWKLYSGCCTDRRVGQD
jgi:nitrate/nitrite-specific signal transduction histidine kinase